MFMFKSSTSASTTAHLVSRFAGAVQKVVHDNLSEEPPAKRIARGRKALRDLFAERGRLLSMKTPVVPTEKTQEDTVPEDANAE